MSNTQLFNERAFTAFLINLIRSINNNLIIEEDPRVIDRNEASFRPDIIVRFGNIVTVVEVKAYRTRQSINLSNAINQVLAYAGRIQAQNALLIISSYIEPTILHTLQKTYNITIWDRNVLFSLTETNIDLRDQLEQLLLAATQASDENIYEGLSKVNPQPFYKVFESIITPNNANPNNTGYKICKTLQEIKCGRADYKKFEVSCTNAVKYLFGDNLSGWTSEHTGDDGLHRFDLIAKITSKHDFWISLSRDFKSRLVIFEFKNYCNPITQAQIYSTEKYLFDRAQRTIAIIIARKGCDRNSHIAMKGALRESGKLIIVITLKELCDLLKGKDKGDDPNSFLGDRVDSILMKLSR